jgi:hypothetical protein
MGKTGLSMRLQETRQGNQFFVFEHNQTYQEIQFKFLDAVESYDPQNIVVSRIKLVLLWFIVAGI